MKSLVGSLVALVLLAMPTLAKESVKTGWPDYTKWTMTDVKPFSVVPVNPVEDYGVPYLDAVQLKLGEVRWYYDDVQNPQARVNELVVFGKVVARAMQKQGEGWLSQLMVDGKWRVIDGSLVVRLVDPKALFGKGEMKGVILETVAEDGKALKVTVTP